jgi:hypothetical protein
MWDKMSLEELKIIIQQEIEKVALHNFVTDCKDDYHIGRSDTLNFVLMTINDMEKGIKK